MQSNWFLLQFMMSASVYPDDYHKYWTYISALVNLFDLRTVVKLVLDSFTRWCYSMMKLLFSWRCSSRNYYTRTYYWMTRVFWTYYLVYYKIAFWLQIYLVIFLCFSIIGASVICGGNGCIMWRTFNLEGRWCPSHPK